MDDSCEQEQPNATAAGCANPWCARPYKAEHKADRHRMHNIFIVRKYCACTINSSSSAYHQNVPYSCRTRRVPRPPAQATRRVNGWIPKKRTCFVLESDGDRHRLPQRPAPWKHDRGGTKQIIGHTITRKRLRIHQPGTPTGTTFTREGVCDSL